MRKEAYLWMEMAIRDLVDAEDMFNEGKWYRSAFFSHQAVEKALKALFPVLLRSPPPPKTHTIGELYRLLKAKGFSLPEDVEEALPALSKYYTVTRYPDAANGPPWESVDKLEAERALKIARSVVEHVRASLNKAGSGGGSG